MNKNKEFTKKELITVNILIGFLIGFIVMLIPLGFIYNKYKEECGTQEIIKVTDWDSFGKKLTFVGCNYSGNSWLYYIYKDGDSMLDFIRGNIVAENKIDVERQAYNILNFWYKNQLITTRKKSND